MTIEERATDVVMHLSRQLCLDKCHRLCERTRLLLIEQLKQVRREAFREMRDTSEN